MLAGGSSTVYGSVNADDVSGTLNAPALGTATSTTATITNVTIENGGSVNLTIKGGSVAGATVKTGGLLTINGNAAANNVTLQGGTLDLQSPKADSVNASAPSASGTLTFASGVNSRLQLDVAQTGTNGTTFAQTITGFAAGDVIDLKSLTAGATTTSSVSNGNTTVTVTGAGATGSETFTFVGNTGTFTTQADPTANFGTDLVEAPCFTSGTLIRTAKGDIAVEDLAIGDTAVTASGERGAIRWIGHRTIDCRRHGRPATILPVRIAAHAFGMERPARDLLVSPGHAICVDILGEVLIPAAALINDRTVTQEAVDTVTYWHVELDRHDILLADNMPVESYLDMGNRSFFIEAGTVVLHASPDAPRTSATHADFCRPFHAEGALVEVVREQLAARAVALGRSRRDRSLEGVHLVVGNTRIEPKVQGRSLRFLVPAAFAGEREAWLVSETSSPLALGLGGDPRTLGLSVGALAVQDGFDAVRTIAADDARLAVGFHDAEPGPSRWTTGRARLPSELWDGCRDAFFLRVDLVHPVLPRWEKIDGAGTQALRSAQVA